MKRDLSLTIHMQLQEERQRMSTGELGNRKAVSGKMESSQQIFIQL